jgi:hypothetical protein
MSKLGKTDYPRSKNEFYPTPISALESLIPHLENDIKYCEPCAGANDLVNNLKTLRPDVICNIAFDIDPRDINIIQKSATDILETEISNVDCFITNPPFKWDMFDPVASHLISLRPTWLLIPADFMHNIRMGPYITKCVKIVSIGRVKWFSDSKASSTDNFCWYLFDKNNNSETKFYGRNSS